jgi:hypothetical protein
MAIVHQKQIKKAAKDADFIMDNLEIGVRNRLHNLRFH